MIVAWGRREGGSASRLRDEGGREDEEEGRFFRVMRVGRDKVSLRERTSEVRVNVHAQSGSMPSVPGADTPGELETGIQGRI